MDENLVRKLVDEAVAENEALFLLDLNFGADRSIKVVVDGDTGVPLSECIRISRHVEHNLDREAEDFSLEVTTPSITDPLTNNRQFNKNIGRTLKVKTDNEIFEGKLTEVSEEGIRLFWKAREPKPIGKGKITVEKEKFLPLSEIKEAKVKIIF
ncbi:ribosome assembly cofactor RimP [Lutimonas saemankumensis]|uniref:ribosome assembly cofactor RimP n=1 Tax=Lutimonas saemankumensis TaxID=483016 RepID=UPI001CD75426|nr:ribosome assembly cofactor RimP [Lutimonas saemankumensis]MCA0932688.1 ribosome assembly cofactor RimP [Lutimonas saemankumensis]